MFQACCQPWCWVSQIVVKLRLWKKYYNTKLWRQGVRYHRSMLVPVKLAHIVLALEQLVGLYSFVHLFISYGGFSIQWTKEAGEQLESGKRTTWGPMRGLKKSDMKRGQIYKLTLRLLERIGLRADSLKKTSCVTSHMPYVTYVNFCFLH